MLAFDTEPSCLPLDSTLRTPILFLTPKEATFGISGVNLCLQLVPFPFYYFAQELIEDLPVPHLDQLPSQPAQLEASLLHPTGVVIHENVLLQTLKLCLCSTELYPDPKSSQLLLPTSCTQGIEQVLIILCYFNHVKSS